MQQHPMVIHVIKCDSFMQSKNKLISIFLLKRKKKKKFIEIITITKLLRNCQKVHETKEKEKKNIKNNTQIHCQD